MTKRTRRVALAVILAFVSSIATAGEAGIEYDGTLEVGGTGLLVDVYPTKGRFRLTAAAC